MGNTILLRLPAFVLGDADIACQAACCSVLGRYYGYPECCIDAFVEDVARRESPGNKRGLAYLPSGESYVPCEACKNQCAQ